MITSNRHLNSELTKVTKKTFVWVSHGWPWPDVLPWWAWTLSHPFDLRQHQRSKLDHRWMSLVVTNVSLKRPFMIYLYSNLIWSMAHPLLAVIFVTEYRFSWLLLLILTSLTVVIFCFAIARSFKCPFLLLARPIWVLYQLPVSTDKRQEQRVNSTLGGNHPHP